MRRLRVLACCALALGCRPERQPPANRPAAATAHQAATTSRPTTTGPAKGVARTEQTADVATTKLTYRELSLSVATSEEPAPWIVAIHGLGDTPEGFGGLFDGLPLRVRVYLVQAPLPYGRGFDWYGTRVLGEPAQLAEAIQRRLSEVEDLLRSLASQRRNQGDALVTGFSQGGILAFAIAVAGLPHVRAALPLAGWLPPALAATPPALPVYAYHGEADTVVPFENTARMVTSWPHRESGPALSFRSFPGVAHTVNSAMRSEWSQQLNELLR